MNVPRQTGEIFELLSKGQFICSNSSDIRIARLYDIIDDTDNFELLQEYFLSINFILERGDEYFYFARKEEKVDLERKLEIACKWIDVVDFFKTYDNSFGSGFCFSPADIAVKISVDAVLKSKADGVRAALKFDEQLPYHEITLKIIENLCKEGFAEIESDILRTYKVLSSFKYLEDLITIISIPEDIQNEIPQ